MKTLLKFLLLVVVFLSISACGNSHSPQQSAEQVSAAASVRFTSGNSACRIPFQIVDELMIVPVTVNDSLQLNLIFDTGFGTEGAMLFDAEIGTTLGLKYVSQAVLGGGGGVDNKTANVAIGATLSLPGVIFSNQTLLVMTHKEAFKDWPVDGVIGRTLCNCLVEINYENSILNLYDGIVANPEDLGEEFQMKFSYGIPVVE
ncbi:hypothetical protein HUU05_06070, partial [candidate division KSB1 bacterium]|nr:hypothetical protein [candidate division KSB1 bacterium]